MYSAKEKSFKAYFHPGRVKTYARYFIKFPKHLRHVTEKRKSYWCHAQSEEYMSTYRPKSIKFHFSQKHKLLLDTIITDSKIFLVGYGDTEIVGTEFGTKNSQNPIDYF